jgi:ribosomal protein S11
MLEVRIMDSNYMVKVQDAKAVDVQKALQAAGIKVTSIIEVYKEKADEAS